MRIRIKESSWGTKMIVVERVVINNIEIMGVKVKLSSGHLLILYGEKGILTSSGIDMYQMRDWRQAVARVGEVRSFEDLLSARVEAATREATELGVKINMRGKEALKRMM